MMEFITGNKGVIGAIAGLLGLILAMNEYGDYKHDQGYELAVSEINAQTAIKLTEANQKALNEIADDNADTAERVRVEYVTQTEIKEVVKYVTEYIEVPANCEPLAAHVVSVLDQSTSAVSRSAPSADTN
jgi:uncharacterized FlaG/YvyC family protein